MKRYLLDTSAFFALRDDEDGAGQVADILSSKRWIAPSCACHIKFRLSEKNKSF